MDMPRERQAASPISGFLRTHNFLKYDYKSEFPSILTPSASQEENQTTMTCLKEVGRTVEKRTLSECWTQQCAFLSEIIDNPPEWAGFPSHFYTHKWAQNEDEHVWGWCHTMKVGLGRTGSNQTAANKHLFSEFILSLAVVMKRSMEGVVKAQGKSR